MAYPPQSIYRAMDGIHVIVDSIGTWGAVDITDDWTRQLGLVDLSRVLGAALAHTNPVITRISDGTSAFIDPRSIRALTSADIVTAESLTKWGGTALTGRDISGDLSKLDVALSTRALEAGGNLATLAGAIDATRYSAAVVRNEREYSLGQSKLYVASTTASSAGATQHAFKLSNPAGKGITIRVKRLTFYSGVADLLGLYFDGTPTNMGAATAGVNLVRGGAAASGTLAASSSAGAAPAWTSAIQVLGVPAGGVVMFDIDATLDANHNITAWDSSGSIHTSLFSIVWEEY